MYSNPLDGFEYKGNPFTVGEMRNTMQYSGFSPATPEYGDGRYCISNNSTGDITRFSKINEPGCNRTPQSRGNTHISGRGGGDCFSKSQIDRMEDFISADRGKLQGALRFGQLISKYHADIVTDYAGFGLAEDFKEVIEKYLKVS